MPLNKSCHSWGQMIIVSHILRSEYSETHSETLYNALQLDYLRLRNKDKHARPRYEHYTAARESMH